MFLLMIKEFVIAFIFRRISVFDKFLTHKCHKILPRNSNKSKNEQK